MQVALWSEVKAGDQVLDVCAAPGGKAIHIAELLNGTGHVEARDLTKYKVALIRDNIERSGLTNINAVCQDLAIYDPHRKRRYCNCRSSVFRGLVYLESRMHAIR